MSKLYVLVAVFLIGCGVTNAPQPATWMVHSDGHVQTANGEALEKWFRDRKVWAWSSDDREYVLRLNCYDESATRVELLKIAEEAMANLPSTAGVKVTVETLEEAIEDKRAMIRVYERDIGKLQAKHGDKTTCLCNGAGCPDCETGWEPVAIEDLPVEFRQEIAGQQRDLIGSIRGVLEVPEADDCGGGVLPDQTEVPAPYPMPDKHADDALADLQKRVTELETAKGIFGNVVLMANDAKIAADEEHAALRKSIKDLQKNLDNAIEQILTMEKDWTNLSALRDEIKEWSERKDVAHAEKPVPNLRSRVFARSDFSVIPKEIPFDISDFEPWGVSITTEITKDSFGGAMPKAFDVRCYLPEDLVEKLDIHVRFSWMYDVSSGRELVRNAASLSFSADETGYYAGYRHPNPIADSVYEMNITIVLRDGARMPVGYRDGLKREHVQVRVAPLKSTITQVP